MSERICVAITGASGSLYALRLIEVLVKGGKAVDVIVSKAAQLVFATEINLALPAKPQAQAQFLAQHFNVDGELIRAFGREDWLGALGVRFRSAGSGGDLSVQYRHLISGCLRCQ